MGTPVIAREAILVDRPPNILVCGSVHNAESKWRLRSPAKTIYAAPLLADKRLFVAAVEGDVQVVDVGVGKLSARFRWEPRFSGRSLSRWVLFSFAAFNIWGR